MRMAERARRTGSTSRRAVLILGVAALLCGARAAEAQQSSYFRIGTAATTASYFQFGGVLASMISAPASLPNCQQGGSCGVSGLIAIAQATKGSAENVQMLGRGELDSGLVQADIASWAFHGTGPYANKPVDKLRAIAAVFPDSIHIVVRRDSQIRSVHDLKARRVELGDKDSGTLPAARLLLEAAGLKERDVRPGYLGVGEALAGLGGGTVDAVFVVGGTPLPAIGDLASTTPVRLLPINDDLAQKLIARDPQFAVTTLLGGTYSGVDEATPTLAINAIWAVTTDTDEQLVYQITKSLWSETTQRVIALRVPAVRHLTIKNALDGVDIPLHPGAERFYHEAGIATARR
jgi:TRAP transporter TAXI family solute receptor